MFRPAMAAAGKADHAHIGGERSLDAGRRVLDHEAFFRSDAHLPCRKKKQVRRGLAARDLCGAEDVVEQIGEACDAQRQGDPLRNGRGSDAARIGQGEDRLAHIRNRPQIRLEPREESAVDLVREIVRQRARVIGNPLKVRDSGRTEHYYPPYLGGDTREVLKDILGYDAAKIDRMVSDRAVGDRESVKKPKAAE